MKKVFVFMALVSLFACSKKANQAEENSSGKTKNSKAGSLIAKEGGPRLECPPGYHQTISWEFNGMNFHRPKYHCHQGFGLCFIDGLIHKKCESDIPNNFKAYVSGSKVIAWGQFIGNQLELHLPDAIRNEPDYTTADLKVFGLDEDMEIAIDNPGTRYILQKGEYNVSESNEELVILINIK